MKSVCPVVIIHLRPWFILQWRILVTHLTSSGQPLTLSHKSPKSAPLASVCACLPGSIRQPNKEAHRRPTISLTHQAKKGLDSSSALCHWLKLSLPWLYSFHYHKCHAVKRFLICSGDQLIKVTFWPLKHDLVNDSGWGLWVRQRAELLILKECLSHHGNVFRNSGSFLCFAPRKQKHIWYQSCSSWSMLGHVPG